MGDPFVAGFFAIGAVWLILIACDSPSGRAIGGAVLTFIALQELMHLLGLLF